MANLAEQWRPVVGYEGAYQVSSIGRVRTVARVAERRDGTKWRIPERMRKLPINSGGYPTIVLFAFGLWKCRSVHSLVMEAFVGPRPDGQSVNHIDFDRQNNRLENLEYVSVAENNRHSQRAGRTSHGETHHFSKITEQQIKDAFALLAQGSSRKAAASAAGISVNDINNVLYGQAWKHLGLAKSRAAG